MKTAAKPAIITEVNAKNPCMMLLKRVKTAAHLPLKLVEPSELQIGMRKAI